MLPLRLHRPSSRACPSWRVAWTIWSQVGASMLAGAAGVAVWGAGHGLFI